MKKKSLFLFVLSILAVSLAFGGGGQDESEASAPAPTSFDWMNYEGSSITFMVPEHPITNGVREILAEFESQTGIEVAINAMAEDLYFDRMNVALRTEGNVDVYLVPMDGDSYIQKNTGLVRSLSPYLDDPIMTASDYDFPDFPSTIMDLVHYSEGYFAIPASLETYILMYNKEIIEKYLDGKVPATMDELINAANSIQSQADGEVSGAVMRGIRSDTLKDTITGIVYNAVGDGGYNNAAEMYMSSPGNFSTVRLTDPGIIRGINRYAQLMKAGPSNIQSMDWPDAARAFELGKAGFFVDANLFAPGFEQGAMAGKVGYSILPIDNSEGKSYSGFWGWGYGIAENSKNPEASWLFIQWLSNKTNDVKIAKFHGSPARNSTWTRTEFTQTMPVDYIEASKEQMASSRSSVIKNEKEKEFYLIIVDAIQEIYGGKSPEQAVREAQEKARNL